MRINCKWEKLIVEVNVPIVFQSSIITVVSRIINLSASSHIMIEKKKVLIPR